MSRYLNPVIPGFNPDPSVCRSGEDYYLVTSSFEFFPGVPVYHSRNLANWELIGHCLTHNEQLPLGNCPASAGIYAPTIRCHEGLFYMVTTNVSAGGNFIVHTEDIRGPWSVPAPVDQGGIDPSLLFMNGKAYFCSNGHKGESGVILCEVDPLTGKKLSVSTCIAHGTGGKAPEAPHLYFIDGWYYLLMAEGGTEYGHMVTIQRSRELYGPYEACPHNPILTHRNRYPHPIQATGHADLFEDHKGNWWMVCLGIRPLPGARVMLHNLGRETFLVPVTWENGWPVAGNNGAFELEMEAPLPLPAVTRNFDFTADFSSDFSVEKSAGSLSPHWNFIRNPEPKRYILDKDRLRIKGSDKRLSDPNTNPSFMGIRQQAFRIEAETVVSAETLSFVRAGISAYYNDSYHYDLYLEQGGDGTKAVVVNKRIHDLEAETYRTPVKRETEDIRLRISSDLEQYHFAFRAGEEEWQDCGGGLAAGLCTEGTYRMTFTGVYIGLFCSGGEAEFKSFSLVQREEL